MISCPICHEPFTEQCAHLLFFKSWQDTFQGTPTLKDAIARIEVSMIRGVQNGHEESPVPELASPYATLRTALAEGDNEHNAVIQAWPDLSLALVRCVRYLDPSVVMTACDSSEKIVIPEEKARLESSDHMIRGGKRSVIYRMKELYWADNPAVLYEMLDYYTTRWREEFAKAPDFPERLENYFPVTADTELSFDADRLGGSNGHIPYDPSPESVLRTLRIALRAAAAGTGPFSEPDDQFLFNFGCRNRIRLETAVRIIAGETPEIVHAALPTIIASSKKAERLIPHIREMAMSDPCRVHIHHVYERLIDFAGIVERFSRKGPVGQCPGTPKQGGEI